LRIFVAFAELCAKHLWSKIFTESLTDSFVGGLLSFAGGLLFKQGQRRVRVVTTHACGDLFAQYHVMVML